MDIWIEGGVHFHFGLSAEQMADLKDHITKTGASIVGTFDEDLQDMKGKLEAIKGSTEKVAADVTRLTDKIVQLEGTIGQPTPEQQTLIEELKTGLGEVAERLQSVDAQTAEDA